NSGRTILAQITAYLPTYEFRQCAERYAGNYRSRAFLSGSISEHGICSTDLQRKSAEYSSLPSRSQTEDLSYGHSRKDLPATHWPMPTRQETGTSENAVKTQIWIAISVYVLMAIIKKKLNQKQNLYTILQIFSVTLFEKIPLLQALTDVEAVEAIEENTETNNQLNLFD
ncbi:MAG TPA: DUF4372 domain-containing protein, partial [Smithellaceae bacterium]|nr:DUF4372 domain-containing protein [Smithellaceae bacterium]